MTHNLANVDTPGFKRELAILQARHSESIEQGAAQAGARSIEDVGGGVWQRETVTAFSPGIFKRTDVATDMAITGDKGFFVVEKDGQQLLTRAGNFHLASDGRLVTQQGYPVLSEDGEPVVLNPALPWSVSEKGVIAQAGGAIPLALTEPQSRGDLAREGENLFSPLAPVSALPADDRRVASGYLEQSNVAPTTEMMTLIETSRAYEANVRLIQHQDQMIGSLVSRVLRQS